MTMQGNPIGLNDFDHQEYDVNQAGNTLNRRSHTGIITYVNNAPIIWFSKQQNTVLLSSFGLELID